MSGSPSGFFPTFSLWSECGSEATRHELPTSFTDLVEATTGNVWPSPWTRSVFCPVEYGLTPHRWLILRSSRNARKLSSRRSVAYTKTASSTGLIDS